MTDVRWLYPTSTAKKAHAFLGSRPVSDPTLGDDVEQGKQSLCRNYGRFLGDMGWQTQDGSPPADACAQCKKRAEERTPDRTKES